MLSALFSFPLCLLAQPTSEQPVLRTHGEDGDAATGMSRNVSHMERICPQWELVT